MEEKIIEVVRLGDQEKIDGTFIFLVNEVESGSTVVYDPKKHVLVED